MDTLEPRYKESPFPHNITVEEARKSIEGKWEFAEKEQEGLIFFNYKYCNRGTFPDPNECASDENKRLLQIRRECRGLVFDAGTGEVVARRFHKFFNIGELEETQAEKIDFSRPSVVLTKYDGTLVSSLYAHGKVRFATKGGLTDVALNLESRFIEQTDKGKSYTSFCKGWMDKGFTPLFEYCSPRHKIVLRYESDRLVLIALRHNATGYYLPYDEMCESAKECDIEVTEDVPRCSSAEGAVQIGHSKPSATAVTINKITARHFFNPRELNQLIRGATGIEGFVIRFDNGEMYKVKTEWYFARTRKSKQPFSFNSEKKIWKMALEQELDDALAFINDAHLTKRVRQFESELWTAIHALAETVSAFVEENRNLDTKKQFVIKTKESSMAPFVQPILFKLYDDPSQEVHQLIVNSLLAAVKSKSFATAQETLGVQFKE